MAELWFIGLGLGDEKDLGRRAVDLLRGCDRIFAEEYTAVWGPGAFERLSEEVGHPIERLSRTEVESEHVVLDALEHGRRVAFLVVGDPFGATTHVALRLAAQRAGYDTGYLPNASILTAAAGLLGLMPYRFGRTVSIPFPAPGFSPTSFLDAIRANRSGDLHTLVLLDLRPDEGRYLTAGEALAILRARDPEGNVIPPDAPVAVVARVGTPGARAWYGPLEALALLDFGPPMHALVLPAAHLHFEEEAALEQVGPG